MFGYVKIAEDELKVRELKVYKNYYCGLCRQIANYSQSARMMLSYDMVFFALLMEAKLPKEVKMCKNKMFKHCKKACGDHRLKYVAAVSVILLYYKLQNDFYDGEKKKKFLMNAIDSGYKKAAMDFPEIDKAISDGMANLYELENNKCADLKTLEKCFCSMFSKVFEFTSSEDEYASLKGEIAYHISAWVYFFDMLQDLEKDKEKGDFNPLLLAESEQQAKKVIIEMMTSHVARAEDLLNLLPYNDCTAIVGNIISLGIPSQMKQANIIMG